MDLQDWFPACAGMTRGLPRFMGDSRGWAWMRFYDYSSCKRSSKHNYLLPCDFHKWMIYVYNSLELNY